MPESQLNRTVGEALSWPADVLLHPDHPLPEAVARLHEKARPFAPVVDGDAVVGVVPLHRLTATHAEGQAPVAVRDCMLPAVPFLYDDDPAALGEAIARQTEINHFCVVDHEHRLLGIYEATGRGHPEPVDEQRVRKRLALTPGRASDTEQGEPRTYADAPTLFVDARRTHEPADRPDPEARRRRHAAMRSKL